MARPTDGSIPADIETIIDEATRRLVEAAHPDRIILFGSYARGDFDDRSDLDFLVILPSVEDPFEDMTRLERALLSLPVPADVLVYSRDDVRERGHLRGTTLYHALTQGKVLHDTA
ncbi:MAG TPA: nucleotidyltransferase domain-containing protein [Chloroflexota bacterium]